MHTVGSHSKDNITVESLFMRFPLLTKENKTKQRNIVRKQLVKGQCCWSMTNLKHMTQAVVSMTYHYSVTRVRGSRLGDTLNPGLKLDKPLKTMNLTSSLRGRVWVDLPSLIYILLSSTCWGVLHLIRSYLHPPTAQNRKNTASKRKQTRSAQSPHTTGWSQN